MPSFKPALYGLFQYHISELKNDLSELNDQAVALPAPFQQPLPHPQRETERNGQTLRNYLDSGHEAEDFRGRRAKPYQRS